jgi:hypothetical protein
MIRQKRKRSLKLEAKGSVLFSIVKSSFNVRELAIFASSEDQATYAKWRHGVLILYGTVGVVAVAAFLAATSRI